MFAIASRPSSRRASGRGIARPHTWPAPVRGWVQNENYARSKPEGAEVLDNWVPTTTGIRIRHGTLRYATLSGGAVTAFGPYVVGTVSRLFATTSGSLFEITTVANANVSPAAILAMPGGNHVFVPFVTTGGSFLGLLNGASSAQVFDGTSWGAWGITGVSSTNLSHAWAFANRLFFVQRDTLNAWYLPVDAISGAATRLPLGGVFRLGGALLFGGTWSYDSGSGLNEACVFVTTEGEVAIFEGADPSSSSTWSLRGVYRIGRPLGVHAWMKAGGDLIIATDLGLVPISKAITLDTAALGAQAVSAPIEEAWSQATRDRAVGGAWHVHLWPARQMAVVSLPAVVGLEPMCFVVNSRTGAWCRFVGVGGGCLGTWRGRGFAGLADGRVVELERGGTDQGAPFTATYVGLFDDLKGGAARKMAKLMRVTFRALASVTARVSIQSDYEIILPAVPSASSEAASGTKWNAFNWGEANWDSSGGKESYSRWVPVAAHGDALAPAVQVTSGMPTPLTIELVSVDVMLEAGSPVG